MSKLLRLSKCEWVSVYQDDDELKMVAKYNGIDTETYPIANAYVVLNE